MAEENVLVLSQASAAAGQANLIRQQEELERKAADLERKEQEMQNRSRASNTGGELLREGVRAMRPHVGNSSVVCLQLRKTTGRLYRTSPPWSRASTRTLRRRSQRSTAGYAGGCITSGCVRTNSVDNAVNVSESNWSVRLSSPQRHAVSQRVGLPGVFHCQRCICCWLWSVYPLVHPLHTGFLCLLVQACLQGLQVHY